MNIHRLSTSIGAPVTSVPELQYLVNLRPNPTSGVPDGTPEVSAQDQILASLRANELPLVTLNAEQSLDFQFIQRLSSETRIKTDLIQLSLMSYEQLDSTNAVNALLNYILARLTEKELLALQALLQTTVVDDTVISNVINLIRLTGTRDPLKFIALLENNLRGTLSLRNFIGGLEVSTGESISQLDTLGSKKVPSEIINAINEQEAQGLSKLNNRADAIESERIAEVQHIQQNANVQRILLNTGITFGVSGLVWAGYRLGVWESLSAILYDTVHPALGGSSGASSRSTDPANASLLSKIQLGLAGIIGFLLKKGLLHK